MTVELPEHGPSPGPGDPVGTERLATRRLDVVRAARAVWPELAVDEQVFLAALDRHLLAEPDPVAAIDRLRAADLYLATACATSDSRAIVAFERHFADVIGAVVARFGRRAEQRDELRQLLREHLFVAEHRAPRIAEYAGRGFLENWLRVTAVRVFVNARRGRAVPLLRDPDTLAALPAPALDLELEFLKVHCREAFRRALTLAADQLEPGERLVLRLALIRGLSVDQVGAALGVHRATAARRVAAARRTLFDGIRQRMAEALSLGGDELDSILRLIDSELDASLSRLLATREADAA